MVYTQCNQMIKSLRQTGTYKARKESLGCKVDKSFMLIQKQIPELHRPNLQFSTARWVKEDVRLEQGYILTAAYGGTFWH